MPLSRIVVIALWVIANLLVGAALHYYAWRKLARNTGLPAPWPRRVAIALAVLGISVVVVFAGARILGPDLPKAVAWPVFVWMGLIIILVLFFAIADGVRALGRVVRRRLAQGYGSEPVVDAERRLMMSRMLAGAAVVTAGSLSGVAMNTALTPPEVRRVRIPLRRLPQAMSGTTIAQVTDLHIGHMIGAEYVRAIIERVNALEPDIIAITGDLVDGTPERLGSIVTHFRELRARHGVYFVTGNHEYYSGAEAWLRFLPDLGIRVLRNERVTIGHGDDSFELAGVDDSQGSKFIDGHGTDVRRALEGCEPHREVVLLAHHPGVISDACDHGVGLQISGHTHGGQMWPFTWLAHLVFPLVHGLGRFSDTILYVSRGAGFVGPPLRIGAPSELALLELVRA